MFHTVLIAHVVTQQGQGFKVCLFRGQANIWAKLACWELGQVWLAWPWRSAPSRMQGRMVPLRCRAGERGGLRSILHVEPPRCRFCTVSHTLSLLGAGSAQHPPRRASLARGVSASQGEEPDRAQKMNCCRETCAF